MRFDRLAATGSSLLVLALSGIAGAQSCFEPHADPGCDDADCEAAVCAEDFFCCDTTWDDTCVDLAKEFCDNSGGGGEDDLDCSSAVTVGLGDHSFTTTFDPVSNIDIEGYCDLQSFGNSIIYNTVWYKWTCPKSEGYVFSTCDQVPFNTRIAIFEGSCNLNNIVTCLDDTVGCSSFTTSIRYTAEAGVDYYICVGGQANFNYGTGVLSIDPAERVLSRVVESGFYACRERIIRAAPLKSVVNRRARLPTLVHRCSCY